MSTSLSFNFFGSVLHRKPANQRRISDPQIIYNGALCDIRGHFVLTSSSNLGDRGMVELPLHAIIFSFYDKIGSMNESKNQENSSISHTGNFSFLGARSIIFCFFCWESVVLWYIHLHSGVSTKFYLNQYPYLGNIQLICKGVRSRKFVISKHEIFSVINFDLKNLFPTTTLEVTRLKTYIFSYGTWLVKCKDVYRRPW